MKLRVLLRQLADPRWRRFYWQRRFMGRDARTRTSARIARRRAEPPGDDAEAKAVADALARDGLVDLGQLLDAAKCAEIRAYFADREVINHYCPDQPPFKPNGEGRHPACHVAYHRDEDVIAAPYLLGIANDRGILDAMHRYFGCRPVISYLAAWWSYPTDVGPQQAENFHRDVDDWSFIKLFVYLTDVDTDSGPHVYVRASAGSPRLNEIRRFGDEEVVAAFGEEALAVQTARAGSAFLENTFGLHKGTQVKRGTRLIFQAVYSLNPLPYGPQKPVAPFDRCLAGGDELRRVNRVYLA